MEDGAVSYMQTASTAQHPCSPKIIAAFDLVSTASTIVFVIETMDGEGVQLRDQSKREVVHVAGERWKNCRWCDNEVEVDCVANIK